MSTEINIYCDESCHLENDGIQVMVLGGLSCPKSLVKTISEQIRQLKSSHGLPNHFEVKWTKVSPAKLDFYLDLVALFFNAQDLEFRALIVKDKSSLDHGNFNQTHDDWYYKMYFSMLKVLIDPQSHSYNIYLDYKDTQGGRKVKKLHDVLSNANYDFSRELINKIQLIRSDESELLPLADLLIGAVAYANRGLSSSQAKVSVVEKVRECSGYNLLHSTLLRERKMNLFQWSCQRGM